ncbi:hypothetical protein F5B19DRAFT_496567 [Rostrohypoxylon terebratum]|nr:hypothetical protein F5B19DRAFT_496567 [Rostrohypoxylon terebratum]
MADDLSSLIDSQLSLSRVRSSRISDVEDDSSSTHASSTPTSTLISGLEDISQALESSGLPGPSVISSPYRYIGQGGQFVVYQGDLMDIKVGGCEKHPVAIKSPKFNIDASKRLDLTDRSAQQHLKNILLEIKALTTPALQQHPNIARLLTWCRDPDTIHYQPQLVMELASSDLLDFLKKGGGDISYQQRYSLCSDIANGLDAIHKCELVHGDLKPGNILIFTDPNRPVAKLSDFGLSVGEPGSDETSVRLGGTPGWRAPELEENKSLSRLDIPKTDIYSFGLVAWSTLLATGESPRGSSEAQRRTWVINELSKCEARLSRTLKTKIVSLLDKEPSKRPDTVQWIFPLNEEDEAFGYRDESKSEPSAEKHQDEAGLSQMSLNDVPQRQGDNDRFHWQLSPIPNFTGDLLRHYMENTSTAPGDSLFSYFLYVNSWQHGAEFRSRAGVLILDVLVVAAKIGYPPAQAVILDVFEFYKKKLPNEVDGDLVTYLQSAVSTGSVFARRHLQSRDPMVLSTSIRRFKYNGGYGSYYCKQVQHNRLHSIVTNGSVAQLKDYLSSTVKIDINQRNTHGDSLLYLACARGSWDIVAELLDRGASASGAYSKYHITCLHWAFAFDPSDQPKAIKRLIQSGADINAKVSQPLPFFHYPFELPAGTPLHWAIVTQSHEAVQALVESGADVNVRDGSDPYQYDHRVRVLGAFGSLNQDVYSFSETGTKGLSPMDYAVKGYDPFLFELLLALKKRVNINDVDEEGFSVLHRLGSMVTRQTRSGLSFFSLPFQGISTEQRTQFSIRTVRAIKSLGGDIERLSTPNVNLAQARQNQALDFSNWETYTPLMLAASSGRPDAVDALLKVGADVNKENNMGTIALHCVSEEEHGVAEIGHILISQGAATKHRNKLGATPLQKASIRKNIELMDMLLSHGADIEDVNMENGPQKGWSVLVKLSQPNFGEDILDESWDEEVARFIDKWLRNANTDKRLRIVRRCDPGGGTLLDTFAGNHMRHTVPVLIYHGSHVNAISQRSTMRFKEEKQFKLIFQKTPLDAAVEAREKEKREMGTKRHHTAQEHARILERAAAVIKALKDAGGTSSTKPDIMIPVVR